MNVTYIGLLGALGDCKGPSDGGCGESKDSAGFQGFLV